jgi:hypothetical protein
MAEEMIACVAERIQNFSQESENTFEAVAQLAERRGQTER